MKISAADGIYLNVEIVADHPRKLGELKPVVFILPGGPGASHKTYMNYACLQEVADLVFYDPRGCGDSEKADLERCTMANYVEDVEAIRKHFALDEIILLGKSYGSMCALAYTLKYPKHVAKLILAAGAPSYHFLSTAKQTLNKIGTPEQIKICEKLWKGDFKSADEVLKFFELTNPLYSIKARHAPESFNLSKKSNLFAFEVLNIGFRHEFWHFDFSNQLQLITCPTLILAGQQDWINDVKYARLMAENIPNNDLIVFEHSGHALEADVGEQYFQRIADFIAR